MEIKLQVDSLTDQAYDILKQKIISKQFPPGMRLVDSQLAKEYGISRTPLRDAIRKLHEDGLVTNYSGRGYCVFQPTEDDINEIFEIRRMIDVAAATKLINEILPNDKEAYATIESFYNEFSADVEREGFIKADEDFHDKMVLMMGNARIYNFYVEIRNQTRTFRRRTSSDKERMARAYNHHEKICRGLLDLDLNAATEALTDHIELSRRNALEDLE
ncbi:MAG: GntR family transcriptional regulator [Clostridiales bacterium]|jgi:DNA-binding GntR family transcriptional regulator|nr:GntR family transcriptional regulator [Clostridiales bacterium]